MRLRDATVRDRRLQQLRLAGLTLTAGAGAKAGTLPKSNSAPEPPTNELRSIGSTQVLICWLPPK